MSLYRTDLPRRPRLLMLKS